MGLSWQQGPLSTGAIGRFLVPEPLPKKLLYVEPLRRRMRVRFGGIWIADSEHVLLHWVTSIHHGDDAMHRLQGADLHSSLMRSRRRISPPRQTARANRNYSSCE
jgi:hypothetical protein